MAQAPVIPVGNAGFSADAEEAARAFISAGFDVIKESGLWRLKKAHRGSDRFLTDDEIILLARSLGRKNVSGAAAG